MKQLQKSLEKLIIKIHDIFPHNVRFKGINKKEGRWGMMKLCLLFHFLGVVFNLISSMDDFIWSAVELVWDDLLKVLDHS